MHSVLGVQEVEGVPGLNESREERSRPINSEGVRRSELFLVADKDYLFRVDCSEEGFILFDHRSFIHDNYLESAVGHDFRGRLSNSGDDDGLPYNDLLLERLLVLEEHFELVPGEFLDCFDVVAKEVNVFLVQLELLLADDEFNVFAVSKLVDLSDFHNRRKVQNLG